MVLIFTFLSCLSLRSIFKYRIARQKIRQQRELAPPAGTPPGIKKDDLTHPTPTLSLRHYYCRRRDLAPLEDSGASQCPVSPFFVSIELHLRLFRAIPSNAKAVCASSFRSECAGGAKSAPSPPPPPPSSSSWLAPNPSKRWGELFFLLYTPFWLTISLGIVVPYKLYEVRLDSSRPSLDFFFFYLFSCPNPVFDCILLLWVLVEKGGLGLLEWSGLFGSWS